MRFIVGRMAGRQTLYLVRGDRAHDLSRHVPGATDLMALIARPAALAGLDAGDLGEGIPLADVEPALPVARPPATICLGLNYVEHVKEGGYEVPDYPALFMRAPASLMPAGAPMVRPSASPTLDYEAELMVVVGKGGRHIAESDALGHVFGYTVFNDGSVREYQRKTHQWTPGKNFDSTGAIGPVVVTPDELPEGAAGLGIESRVGGEVLQSSNTANMIWGVAKAISIISGYTTLEPGTYIAMGTPPGVGHARKPEPRWLRPGETVEVEIERIGICASPVIDEDDARSPAG